MENLNTNASEAITNPSASQELLSPVEAARKELLESANEISSGDSDESKPSASNNDDVKPAEGIEKPSDISKNTGEKPADGDEKPSEDTKKVKKLHWSKVPGYKAAVDDTYIEIEKAGELKALLIKLTEDGCSDTQIGKQFLGCTWFVVKSLKKKHGAPPSKFANGCRNAVCKITKIQERLEEALKRKDDEKDAIRAKYLSEIADVESKVTVKSDSVLDKEEADLMNKLENIKKERLLKEALKNSVSNE